MVAKIDMATTAKPPITMSRTRPIDDPMADFSPYRSLRSTPPKRFYTCACQTAKGWLQRRAIGHDRRQMTFDRATLPSSSTARRPLRRHIFSKDVSNGPPARHRHPAAQSDEARLPRAHERRQSALHGEGQGIRVRLLGRRPPLRLWRLQVHRRSLETGGTGLDRHLRAQGWIERARRRLRQGVPALRDEENSAGAQDRRFT